MSTLLKIENVSKSYTRHKALDDVSLEVERGSVYGLLGPNGAGKTTLIRVITRITMADSGRVLFDGKPLTEGDIFKIGYMPEERGLYKKMRVGEQAMFFARMKGLERSEAVCIFNEKDCTCDSDRNRDNCGNTDKLKRAHKCRENSRRTVGILSENEI